MLDTHSGSAASETTAQAHDSFRARLLARGARRPQSTFAIDSGIVYRPGATDSAQARRAAVAVRDELRRRRAEVAAAAVAPVEEETPEEPAAPAVALAMPAAAAPEPMEEDELMSAIEAVVAHKAEEQARTFPAEMPPPQSEPEAEAAIPVIVPGTLAHEAVRAPVQEPEAPVDIATRIGDISQIAFAGLAVLGLAGLSVMAAENALKAPQDPYGTDTDEDNTSVAPELNRGGASSVALAAAVPAEPQAWFNYQGVADMLAERKAEMEAAAAAAREEAEREARLQAARAIANAEAARVAEEEEAAAAAAEEARLADAAERQRLADAEAARVADEEARRLADAEAARQAAAEAEAQRVADLEARRKAEAEAEARRLADLDAQRLARLEAERKAAEEAARREAFEQAKAAEAERLRLAAIAAGKLEAQRLEAERQEAERLAADAEARRLAAAKADADRLAAEKALAERQAAEQAAIRKAAATKVETPAAPTPQVIEFAPYQGPVPAPASYKPEKPAVMLKASVSSVSKQTVSASAPKSLQAGAASVRAFTIPASPRTPEAFLASRVERTASAPVPAEDLALVQEAFLSILDKGADGSAQTIVAPDGRIVSIVLERTVSREMGQSTVRTVTYTPGVNSVTRVVTEQAPVTVSVMCRDVAYAFAGQERGRFAACQSPDGGWTLARATDVVEVQTASLPRSAS